MKVLSTAMETSMKGLRKMYRFLSGIQQSATQKACWDIRILKDGLKGPSVVFSEEVRDIRDENPRDMQSELFDKMNNRIPNTYNPIIFVAAHEAMHRFYGWHKQGKENGTEVVMRYYLRPIAST